ncbi:MULTISPECIES: ketopantoate reductase C-terminal domain-containing protein [unclassified Streptomyces]|uniref:ketopantoate reductase C-terminal domain-containing protein n=1 Tax=unclassified Streptomyces TaxID=2593676 RepID=UPI0036F6B438
MGLAGASPGSAFATRLYRGFRHNQATEVEPITGGLCRVAAQHGVSVPLLRAAAVRLRVHGSRLTRRRDTAAPDWHRPASTFAIGIDEP